MYRSLSCYIMRLLLYKSFLFFIIPLAVLYFSTAFRTMKIGDYSFTFTVYLVVIEVTIPTEPSAAIPADVGCPLVGPIIVRHLSHSC